MSFTSSHFHRLIVAAALVVLAAPRVAEATKSSCSEGTPAVAVDPRLWGVLRPGDIAGGNQAQLPNDRDSTDYTGNSRPDHRFPEYSSLDVENGYVFTTYSSGFRVWDARTDPLRPTLLAGLDGWQAAFPEWPSASELKEILWDVDAPSGNDGIVAVSGLEPAGLYILDTTNKGSIRTLYQENTKTGYQVYAASIAGRD